MINADKTIEAIDKKLKEEEKKGTVKEYLLDLGFSLEDKNIPNIEKTKSEKSDDWPSNELPFKLVEALLLLLYVWIYANI